jgi:hypothetical protein
VTGRLATGRQATGRQATGRQASGRQATGIQATGRQATRQATRRQATPRLGESTNMTILGYSCGLQSSLYTKNHCFTFKVLIFCIKSLSIKK